MTGFGYETFNLSQTNYTLEIKTLNSRHLEVKVNLPESLSGLEIKIHEKVKKFFSRGQVLISLKEHTNVIESESLIFNYELIEQYITQIDKLKQVYQLKGDLDLESLLKLPNIISFKETSDYQKVETYLLSYLDKVCELVLKSREKEGSQLKLDLLKRSQLLREYLLQIKERLPIIEKAYRERVNKRLLELTNDLSIETHINQEIALLIEKNDITEEVIRLESHLKLLEEALHLNTVIGRRLEFIIQEIQREINTVGSKSNDALLSESVIDFKAELEKIKEQIQNIE